MLLILLLLLLLILRGPGAAGGRRGGLRAAWIALLLWLLIVCFVPLLLLLLLLVLLLRLLSLLLLLLVARHTCKASRCAATSSGVSVASWRIHVEQRCVTVVVSHRGFAWCLSTLHDVLSWCCLTWVPSRGGLRLHSGSRSVSHRNALDQKMWLSTSLTTCFPVMATLFRGSIALNIMNQQRHVFGRLSFETDNCHKANYGNNSAQPAFRYDPPSCTTTLHHLW